MSATYEEILQGMLNKVTNEVDKREGSIIYDALAPCAYFLAQQQFQIEHFFDLVFTDTAIGDYLDRAAATLSLIHISAGCMWRTCRRILSSRPFSYLSMTRTRPGASVAA